MAYDSAFPPPEKVQEALIEYHKRLITMPDKQWNFRERMREIDIAYQRERDLSKTQSDAKAANARGDSNRIQNITVPVIKPAVDTAVDYQAAVFLTDYPLLGVISDPANMDAAMQMQALIEENSIRCGWIQEFLLFFNDIFKYNLGAIEVCWDKVVTAALDNDPAFQGGKEGKPREIIWSGNKITRWDLYNSYWDTRVYAHEVAEKGEFAGRTQLMSRTQLKTFINQLDGKILANIRKAFESRYGSAQLNTAKAGGYYIPEINPDSFIEQSLYGGDENWLSYLGGITKKGGGAINYTGIYEVSTEYIRIMPVDFGLKVPAENTPQVWKLIVVNHQVPIFFQRMTNAHEKIPVLFGSPYADGLGYQTKSLAEDSLPFQDVASALMNSVLHGRRRAATDRVVYDPSRIDPAHINSPNPSAKIPLRPIAFGTNPGEAVYQFPYRDDQASMSLQEIRTVVDFGNTLNGGNPARFGQFVKGNKTDGQWESVMQNATSKDQRTSLLLEAQVFTPLKEILKLNYMQYQGGVDIYSPSKQKTVTIDPVALRQAVVNFKITDGLLPKEKVMSLDTMKVAMQVIGSSPQIGAAYNIGPLFSYIMKTANVDLSPFQKSPAQVAYEQAVQLWQQQAQLATEKGIAYNVPQPTPQAFGWDPNQELNNGAQQ